MSHKFLVIISGQHRRLSINLFARYTLLIRSTEKYDVANTHKYYEIQKYYENQIY